MYLQILIPSSHSIFNTEILKNLTKENILEKSYLIEK